MTKPAPLWQRRILDISTAHMRPETRELLTRTPVAEWPVAGYHGPYGFLIYCHDEDVDGTIPPDLWHVIEWARREHRADYVLLDCDADVIDGLPTFDD